MTGQWRLSPHFLVRSTGFPVELLAPLSCADAAAALDDVLDSEEALTDQARSVEQLLAGEPAKDRRRWWKAVHSGRKVGRVDASAPVAEALRRWDAAVARHEETMRGAVDVCVAELARRRAELRETFADPRFGEAVWLSSPQMYEYGLVSYLAGKGGPSALRRTERQLVAYLQRFCTKNDTAAFFGPIDYGGVGADGPRGSGPGTVRVREAFLAAWAVAALADALATEPSVRPHLRPTRTGLFHFDPVRGVLELPDGSVRRLGTPECALLARVDGRRTVRDLAGSCGLPLDDALDRLDRLARAGLLRSTPGPPVLDAHPVRWLRAWVTELPEDCPARAAWLAELTAFTAAEADFATQPFAVKRRVLEELEERFTRLTGTAARRGGGAFYADRLLVYEEAAGDAGPFRLSPEEAERLRARLAPVLEYFAAEAVAAQNQLRAWGAGMLAAGPMPLLRWVAALRDHAPAAPAARLTLDGADEREVVLDPAGLPTVDPAAHEVLLSSPDVMLLAAPGQDGDLVIGECHDSVLVWGWALRYHPDPVRVERDNADLLRWAADDHVLANILPSRRIKIVPFEYPGPTIELAATSAPDDRLRVPAAEVTVLQRNGRPTLTAAGIGDFCLYNGELHTSAHRVLAPPRVVPPAGLDAGAHTPRLRIGSVIVGRERWRVAPRELFPDTYQGDSPRLLLDYRRAARRLGLPRFVFARVAAEAKPVYVDAQSWFLIALLHHLTREAEEVVLTEMLPAPDQLWLSGQAGRYCAELRLTMFRGAS